MRPVCHGIWRGIFHTGKSWNVSDFQFPLCIESADAADRGNSHDLYALRADPDPDIDSSEKVSAGATGTASGGICLWLSDRFCTVGTAGCDIYCLLAAMDLMHHRHYTGRIWRQHGVYGECSSACRRGRRSGGVSGKTDQSQQYEDCF